MLFLFPPSLVCIVHPSGADNAIPSFLQFAKRHGLSRFVRLYILVRSLLPVQKASWSPVHIMTVSNVDYIQTE